MMIRNERFSNSKCIAAEVIDLDAGTYTVEQHGQVVEGPRPLTLDERRLYGPQPLEPLGAAMTLLAVLGVVPLDDAANAVGLTPDDLIAEAEAWAVGSQQASAVAATPERMGRLRTWWHNRRTERNETQEPES